MASYVLASFVNPQGNSDADALGLTPPNTYPLTLNPGNSYTYNYPNPTFEYALVYNSGLNQICIRDNTNSQLTTFYTFNGTQWNCTSDIYSRASMLATYFTTNAVAAPQIFIRPKVFPSSIIYTVNSNAQIASSINLVVTGSGSSNYSFYPTSNWFQYSVGGLTIGCNYSAYAYQFSSEGSNGPSAIFRTVTTGYDPGPVRDLSGVVIGTNVKLNWNFSASNGSAPIGWHVIRDLKQGFKYNVPGTLSTYTAPLLSPGSNLLSVEAVNDPGYSYREYWSTIIV
jgi:hypothetical protein